MCRSIPNSIGSVMCAEARQEELLLDALSICGMPLAVLGQMLAPAALLGLELLPEEVSLEPLSAPYKYLLVCKVRHHSPESISTGDSGVQSGDPQGVPHSPWHVSTAEVRSGQVSDASWDLATAQPAASTFLGSTVEVLTPACIRLLHGNACR